MPYYRNYHDKKMNEPKKRKSKSKDTRPICRNSKKDYRKVYIVGFVVEIWFARCQPPTGAF